MAQPNTAILVFHDWLREHIKSTFEPEFEITTTDNSIMFKVLPDDE